jgi:hypothetical protein
VWRLIWVIDMVVDMGYGSVMVMVMVMVMVGLW